MVAQDTPYTPHGWPDAASYDSQLYAGPVPHPGALTHDEKRLVVVHTDPAHYEGTSSLEMHTYQVRTYQRGRRTLTERRCVGVYPLAWLQGYPEDHALGECEPCSDAYLAWLQEREVVAS